MFGIDNSFIIGGRAPYDFNVSRYGPDGKQKYTTSLASSKDVIQEEWLQIIKNLQIRWPNRKQNAPMVWLRQLMLYRRNDSK